MRISGVLVAAAMLAGCGGEGGFRELGSPRRRRLGHPLERPCRLTHSPLRPSVSAVALSVAALAPAAAGPFSPARAWSATEPPKPATAAAISMRARRATISARELPDRWTAFATRPAPTESTGQRTTSSAIVSTSLLQERESRSQSKPVTFSAKRPRAGSIEVAAEVSAGLAQDQRQVRLQHTAIDGWNFCACVNRTAWHTPAMEPIWRAEVR